MAGLMLLLPGCEVSSGGDGGGGPGSGEVTATVGASGGVVTGANGARVEVPSDSVDQSVPIAISIADIEDLDGIVWVEIPATVNTSAHTITAWLTSFSFFQPGASSDAEDDGVEGAGPAYEVVPHGLKFSEEVKLVIPYEPSDLPAGLDEADLKLFKGECVSKCHLYECGLDGCGNICGTCEGDSICGQGQCMSADECVADCTGKACGPDGCGGSCGTCDVMENCGPGAACVDACEKCIGGICPNYGFEMGDWPYWNLDGDAVFVTQLGGAAPVEGGHAALISSGLRFPAATRLSRYLCLSKAVSKVGFSWKFYSEEFEEWCGSSYQDVLRIVLVAGETEEVLLERTVDSLCKPEGETCEESDCIGTEWVGLSEADVGFDQGGVWMTPWQHTEVDVGEFMSGLSPSQAVQIHFAVEDVGDSIFDTAVLLDDIRFE
jgi:hypothetical protein